MVFGNGCILYLREKVGNLESTSSTSSPLRNLSVAYSFLDLKPQDPTLAAYTIGIPIITQLNPPYT
jgi:hypothetical protein